ncbi:hypothetical protein [Solitalea lacus]|uniref:hypothetical protein n=1 Tax=Solitalea lacus TaxID=2911172 RepID=UPI001ED9F095|nr:hypothetical protein [Solitalea lacus]UKJ06706.1 hypothetical protein L2B55_14355 [Solitalea lacus]
MARSFLMRSAVKFIVLFIIPASLYAQEDTSSAPKKFTLNGYLKDMQIMSFGSNVNGTINDNIIHNRLNFRWYPMEKTTVGVEMRNRVFMGETIKSIPGYSHLLDFDPGLVDMSFLIIDEPGLIFLSQIDRAWINWNNDKWDIRIGRQRLNWGMNLFWNSNDLFNAYSLVDFDYEERPGVDALRVQRFFNNMKSLELAIKPGKNADEWVGGILYRFNKWQYDFQVLAGWWFTDTAFGAGWAGNIGNAGFKGEVTYFSQRNTSNNVLSLSISTDYVFRNQLFLTIGFLLNSGTADTNFSNPENLFMTSVTAKNLMPTKYSGIISVNYPFTPLLIGGFTAVYSPEVRTAFFMPQLGYSIAKNWELALFGQSYWLDMGKFNNISYSVFLRLKWSF